MAADVSFPLHRRVVRPGVELAFWRLGPSGGPGLLLVHGWPETKRIWARVVQPLADAGLDVVVPDLRGFGDSGLAPDGFYDVATHARDLHALMASLGHEAFALCAGDLGGPVVIDLGLRFPGAVVRQVLFNCPLPVLPDMPPVPARSLSATDYYRAQGKEADALAASLRTPEDRNAYVRTFYTSRFWAAPGAFGYADARWHAEPFEDAEKLRASFANYEHAVGARPWAEKPRFLERVAVETLALHGPDDHVIPEDWPDRARIAFERLVGPFVVPRCGHFLPWEQPEVLAGALIAFLRDLLP